MMSNIKILMTMKLRTIIGVAAVLAMASCGAPSETKLVTVGNPYLPLWEHIPDGEPYVFEDPDMPGEYRVLFMDRTIQ